jgi:hypothetical protein
MVPTHVTAPSAPDAPFGGIRAAVAAHAECTSHVAKEKRTMSKCIPMIIAIVAFSTAACVDDPSTEPKEEAPHDRAEKPIQGDGRCGGSCVGGGYGHIEWDGGTAYCEYYSYGAGSVVWQPCGDGATCNFDC